MKASPRPKGPWIHRFSIRLFTVVLAVLFYWALGFLVEDIESIQGPQYDEIEKNHVDQALVEQELKLATDITEVDLAISSKRDEMRIVSDSSQSLQNTINQLIELQKLAIQKSAALPETEQANLSESLARFLDSQKQYQTYNTGLSELTDRKRRFESERMNIEKHTSGSFVRSASIRSAQDRASSSSGPGVQSTRSCFRVRHQQAPLTHARHAGSPCSRRVRNATVSGTPCFLTASIAMPGRRSRTVPASRVEVTSSRQPRALRGYERRRYV